jgi:EamA-like transporter family protein
MAVGSGQCPGENPEEERDRWRRAGREGRDAPKGPRDLGAEPPAVGTVVYIVFLCALWGGNMVAMKISLGGVPPLSAAGIRFLLGSISLLLFAFARRVPLRVDPALSSPG